jgi:hypothetical protein
LFYFKVLYLFLTGNSEDGFEHHYLPVAKAYGRSPKNVRRYSKRKAVVEAEGRPPLQARDHMATVFYFAVDNSRSSARDGLERSRRRTCAFALFS